MSTRWQLLNPLTNTAVLLPGICDDGRDLLIDMSCAGNDLPAALASCGRTISDIAHVLITHDHGDHFDPGSARCFLGTDTQIHIVEYGYQRLINDPVFDAVRPTVVELDEAGLINRLPESGSATFSGVNVCWEGNWHLDTTNLSFRIHDMLISGDVPHRLLFSDPASPLFADGSEGPVRTAILQTTMLDAADALARGGREEDVLRRLEHTGTATALIDALCAPEWRPFFSNVETIVPHHLRGEPRQELAEAIRTALLHAGREQGYSFSIDFSNPWKTTEVPLQSYKTLHRQHRERYR